MLVMMCWSEVTMRAWCYGRGETVLDCVPYTTLVLPRLPRDHLCNITLFPAQFCLDTVHDNSVMTQLHPQFQNAFQFYPSSLSAVLYRAPLHNCMKSWRDGDQLCSSEAHFHMAFLTRSRGKKGSRQS